MNCLDCEIDISARRGAKRCIPCQAVNRKAKRQIANAKYRMKPGIKERESRYHAARYLRLKVLRPPDSRVCLDCQTSIAGRGPRALRCVECARLHAVERDRPAKQRYDRENADMLREKGRIHARLIRALDPEGERAKAREYKRQRYASDPVFRERVKRRARLAGFRQRTALVDSLSTLQDGLCGDPNKDSVGKGCERPLDDRVEVDHIIPVAKGGVDHIANFQLLHRACNQAAKHLIAPQAVQPEMAL